MIALCFTFWVNRDGALEMHPVEELKRRELLNLRVFIDKGIIEVFANDRQAIARTVYFTLGGSVVQLFAKDGNAAVLSVKTWDMAPSNSY